MSKQDFLKGQTYFIKMDIHCEGCKEKVRKQLKKIDGVYSVKIDAEQGRIAVTGNVDPATLIKKLSKSGKKAELWGGPPQKGSFNLNNQFKNLQMDNFKGGKDGKSQKGGKDQKKNGAQEVLQQMQKFKGSKDLKFPKDQKAVKFKVPEDDFDDEFDEEFDDEYDDEYDDESDFDDGDDGSDGSSHKSTKKTKTVAGGGGGKHGHGHGDHDHDDGKKGASGMMKGLMSVFGKAKKESGDDKPNRKGGKHDDKKASSKNGKGENQNQGGKGGKHGGEMIGGGKNGGASGKGFNNGGVGGGGKNNDGWGKNGGGKMNGGQIMNNMMPKGGMNMNQMPPQMGSYPGMQMPQMGNYPGGQMRMPPGMGAGAPPMMNSGFHPGMGQGGNPYMNQQLMAQMMMMNQQANGGGMYQHPMMYARPPMPMPGAMAHPASDEYTFMFNDENANSCSIM